MYQIILYNMYHNDYNFVLYCSREVSAFEMRPIVSVRKTLQSRVVLVAGTGVICSKNKHRQSDCLTKHILH